ncbi:acyl-CoA dehydrogenase family protein [Spirillospora sp. NPDC048819]|uniref:acyl-CoA dehydrogenase family protein n=1 Tax=Spirillospora sp. NPDC048819 TaxID=3155268 RepID=UPI00340407D6
MDFQLSADQLALQEMARDFFAGNGGIAGARAVLAGDGELPDVSADLRKLGLLGLLAESGDEAGTVLDLAVVAEQAGRTLTPTPLAGTAARAVPLLRDVATPPAAELLGRILDGAVRVAVADVREVELSADGTVSGVTGPAPGGTIAGTLIMPAWRADGAALVSVQVSSHAVAASRPALDPTRELATFELTSAPATVLATGEAATAAWERARDIAVVVLAAEDLGTTGECVRRAVEYAKDRTAFGRRIGSFQAVKHALVDAYVAEEQLRSLVWLAAWSADADPRNLPLYASAAAAYAAGAAERAAETLIQVHGGIGFTWEHDAHLFWRRAKVDRALLGDVHEHRARVARLQLAGVSA